MAYKKYIDEHGRLIEEHTDENNETITDYVGVFVEEYIDERNSKCKKYIDKNGVVTIISEKPEGHKGLWIRDTRFLGEISLANYILKKYSLIFSKFNVDQTELRKEMIKANKDFEKRKQENLELYEELAKKIDDDKNKS
ncbi:hypothetical protein ACIQYG_20815 [Peribacillus sp. NPDC096622]|uniref:hypothetical protein n=1 Tax=Peribacillus sp. NPDC096622 TaxID=3364396 RepID=UPI003819DD97